MQIRTLGFEMPFLEVNFGREGTQVFKLKPEETIVGRYPFCDVLLDVHGVSRRHSRISRRGNDYFIDDLNSINGTYVNKERVESPVPLKEGDTIHFYRISAIYRHEEPEISEESRIESPTPAVTLRTNGTEQVNPATPATESSGSAAVRLEAVLQVVSSLGRGLDLNEVLESILDGLFEVFPQSRRGHIWLLDEETGDPILRAIKQTGSQTQCSDSFGPLRMRIAEDVIRQGKSLLSVEEIDEEFSFSALDERLQSQICAPLVGPLDQRLGAICIDSDDGDRPFGQSDLDILTCVTLVAGQAVEYALQHENLVQRAIDFTQEKSRRSRAEEKLSEAESIQRTLYPSSDPQLPGFDIAGEAYPTEEGCGDYFDFIPLSDGRLAVTVGDVSGHGLGAALYMVETRAFVRAFAAQGLEPAELLAAVNRQISAEVAEGAFVTLFYGVIDPVKKTLTYASAGHLGFLLGLGGDYVKLPSTGLVLGFLPECDFELKTVSLQPGTVLALPTDGFFEVTDSDRQLLGADRMMATVDRARSQSASDIITSLFQSCREFSEHAPLQDDMTCVLVKIH